MPRWTRNPREVEHHGKIASMVRGLLNAPVIVGRKDGRRVKGRLAGGPVERDLKGAYRGAVLLESADGRTDEIDYLDIDLVVRDGGAVASR